jgi:aspartate-semialdehyde dehydrogenase
MKKEMVAEAKFSLKRILLGVEAESLQLSSHTLQHLQEGVLMKVKVAVLGATGTVGQKMIRMLENHPTFEIAELAASERSAGKVYGEITKWREQDDLPERIAAMTLKNLDEVTSPYAISSLPASVAREVEPALAGKGVNVVSNASALRMVKNVPLVIPEINAAHLSLLSEQGTSGKIVTNPNCSTVFLALGLAPLIDIAPIEHVNVVTLQALSGAGYPGVSSNDVIGNIIPFIGNEEDKIETEAKRILGAPHQHQDFSITCHVHRVPVLHGHTVATHVHFKTPVTPEEVEMAYAKWNKKNPGLFKVHTQDDRPQPLRDITNYDQRCHIGRIKQGGTPNIVGFVSQGHNLVRGAAGAALLNLELLHNFLSE